MIRTKISKLDLFIKVVDWNANKYIPVFGSDFIRVLPDYYTLVFTFEDWTTICNSKEKVVKYVAKYVNFNNTVLVKFSADDLSELCDEIANWNKEHSEEIKQTTPINESAEVLFQDVIDAVVDWFLYIYNRLKNKLHK